MTAFQKLFGIEESRIKPTCILAPLLPKGLLKYLGINRLLKGKPYSTGNGNSFSLIHTGIGPAFTGDAALYLEKTPCKNIILFGSCGLVKQDKMLGIGSIVIPYESYSLESFSDMLLVYKKAMDGCKVFNADEMLIKKFLDFGKGAAVQKTRCATLGSLKLEEDYLNVLEEKGIQVVDMESSSLFSASERIKKNAMALLYITDIIRERPFYGGLSDKEKSILSSSIKSAAHMLCEFIKKNPNA